MEFFSLLELNDFDENKIVDFKIKLSKEGSMKYQILKELLNFKEMLKFLANIRIHGSLNATE